MMNNTKFVSGKDQKKQINACVDGPFITRKIHINKTAGKCKIR